MESNNSSDNNYQRGIYLQALLIALANKPEGIKVAELGEQSGLNDLELHRLLKQLEKEGRVRQKEKGVYALNLAKLMPPALLIF